MKDLFPRVGRWHRGYQPAQVEAFFSRARAAYEAADGAEPLTEETVRSVAFDVVVDGYSTPHVDAALDRLEAAVVRRRRADFVRHSSEQKWVDAAIDRATTLYPRLQREEGERFAEARGRGYAKTEVDALCERLIDYFENGTPISAQQIRLATFAAARNQNAYDEAVVDSFLDRAVEVLLAVE
ncbi:MAG TPA: DivIVA domain-containing protein [Actinomycetales bacterium]|nr:DivIVA domain-containing protein [Actinomycetales bacterium]